MTMRDDRFEPELGRMQASRGRLRRESQFLPRVLKAAAKAGGCRKPRQRGGLGAPMHGRGAGIGRLLGLRLAALGPQQRQVVVKAQRLALSGPDQLASHLRYIQRDGVSRLGAPGQLYDDQNDRSDAKAFLRRLREDELHYRIMLAPEDGADYDDLQALTRRLMRQMERDLGSRLDWIAADHFNTGHPHSHIVLRGRDDRGALLGIARDYLNHGLRCRASQLVSADLGPPERDPEARRERGEAEALSFTEIDRRLLQARDGNGLVRAAHPDPWEQALRARRLDLLQTLGLARPAGPGLWRLDDGCEAVLRRIGARQRAFAIVRQHMGVRALQRGPAGLVVHEAAGRTGERIIGRLLAQGIDHAPADGAGGRAYLILDGIDGRSHYVEAGLAMAALRLPQDGILQICRRMPALGRQHGGSMPALASCGPGDRPLPAAPAGPQAAQPLRQAGGRVEDRPPDAAWELAVLSAWPLQRQIAAEAVTWLDRLLVADAPLRLGDAGFARDLRAALAARRQWLIAQGLAMKCQGRPLWRAGMLQLLQQRSLRQLQRSVAAAARLTAGRGRRYGLLDLADGRFVVVADARQFSLLPWRLAFDGQRIRPTIDLGVGQGLMRLPELGLRRTAGLGRLR